MQNAILIIHLVIAVLLIFIVLVQEGKDPGMRGIQGSSAEMGDSFFKNNGGTTKEAMYVKMTTCVAILFLVTTMALVVLSA